MEYDARRDGLPFHLADLPPLLGKLACIGGDVFRCCPNGGGADDEARRLAGDAHRVEALDHFADKRGEARALVLVLDAARKRDARLVRHENEKAAGNGDIGGKARALVADGVLYGLNENGLAFMDAGTDGRERAFIEACELAEATRLARTEKARALKPHFHKGGLHAGQYALHTAEKDVADERMAGAARLRLEVIFHGPFKEQFHRTAILDDCNPRFAGAYIDQHFFGHRTPGSQSSRPHADECSLFTLDRSRSLH